MFGTSLMIVVDKTDKNLTLHHQAVLALLLAVDLRFVPASRVIKHQQTILNPTLILTNNMNLPEGNSIRFVDNSHLDTHSSRLIVNYKLWCVRLSMFQITI